MAIKYLLFTTCIPRVIHNHSPLFENTQNSKFMIKILIQYIYKQKNFLQDYSAREWVKQGAPKEKLMIGMPTYGRSFTLVDKSKFDIGAPASGGGLAGNFTNEPGFLSYYEVCNNFFRKMKDKFDQ